MRAANPSQDSLVAVDKDFGPAVADLVIAVTPFSQPSARFVAAALRAGSLGVIDLTSSDRKAREALALVNEWTSASFGVRLAGSAFADADLPAGAGTVLLADWSATGPSPADFPGRRVLMEVTDADEAARATRAGAHGLIARGNEAGGRVGELSPTRVACRSSPWLCPGRNRHAHYWKRPETRWPAHLGASACGGHVGPRNSTALTKERLPQRLVCLALPGRQTLHPRRLTIAVSEFH